MENQKKNHDPSPLEQKNESGKKNPLRSTSIGSHPSRCAVIPHQKTKQRHLMFRLFPLILHLTSTRREKASQFVVPSSAGSLLYSMSEGIRAADERLRKHISISTDGGGLPFVMRSKKSRQRCAEALHNYASATSSTSGKI